ncbi:MAG: LysM peptidoglycan-binding domain-containing protein [Chloroflexi bacterium]|nr:LysM peptidoglycan-binding domain-containing protein [Chloroflexota bacterium]
MHNHEPKKYKCPFCQIIEGAHDSMEDTDVIYQDADVTAFLSKSRWEKNPFDVLIVPNRHIENLYDLPDELAPALQKATREVAIALKDLTRCKGISTRQHNEPAGDQDVWHYHIHVTPRYEDDRFYENLKVPFPESERMAVAERLRECFNPQPAPQMETHPPAPLAMEAPLPQGENLPEDHEEIDMNRLGSSYTYRPLNTRRKKAPIGPRIFGLLAILVIGLALYLIISSLIGPGKPVSNMFATDTATPTVTFTPTSTATATATSTETMTPTITNTPTPSAPFQYTIVEGDNLVTIAQKFNLAEDGIPLILQLNPTIALNLGVIFPGQTIFIPNPDMHLPTATSIPADVPRGTLLTYLVLPGDTLAGIAAKFNSTVEAIMEANDITDANALSAYVELQIPVNMVTATATRPPTSTAPAGTPSATSTPTATNTP